MYEEYDEEGSMSILSSTTQLEKYLAERAQENHVNNLGYQPGLDGDSKSVSVTQPQKSIKLSQRQQIINKLNEQDKFHQLYPKQVKMIKLNKMRVLFRNKQRLKMKHKIISKQNKVTRKKK